MTSRTPIIRLMVKIMSSKYTLGSGVCIRSGAPGSNGLVAELAPEQLTQRPDQALDNRTPAEVFNAGTVPSDDQPYPLNSPHGELFALPGMVELDDVVAMWNRRVTVGRNRDMLKESFDTLYLDDAQTGRLLVINLHPWLTGQPFRTGYLDDALTHMTQRGEVWAASGSDIIDWYQRNAPVVNRAPR